MNEKTATNPVHAWYKSALSVAYMPDMEPQNAIRTLNRWISTYPGLLDQLKAAGYVKSAKILTPAQVQLIFNCLGEP